MERLKRHRYDGATMPRGGRTLPSAGRESRWHMRGTLLGLGLLGTFLAASRGAASQAGFDRLSRHPREMAQATRTERAGLLSSSEKRRPRVYVPTKCVGTRPCPLVFSAHPSASGIRWLADKYGFVVADIGSNTEDRRKNTAVFEAHLAWILQHAVIDLEKIALLGHCAGGPAALALAAQNLDIFSRIAVFSFIMPALDSSDLLPNGKTQFLIGEGILDGAAKGLHRKSRIERRGHPVKWFMGFRAHTQTWETFNFTARWFLQSWTIPDPAARPVPGSVPEVLLTTEALTQLTAFWKRFMQEPDSIRTAARRAHLREIRIHVAGERITTEMTDIGALAARYPSVAAALRDAGLTAQQHDAYRVALMSAIFTQNMGGAPPTATSTQQKNYQFLQTHPDELNAIQSSRDMLETS